MPRGTTSGSLCAQSGGFSQLSRSVVSLWATSAIVSAAVDATSGTTAPLTKRRVCWLAAVPYAPFSVEVSEIHECIDISPQIPSFLLFHLSFPHLHAVIPAKAGIHKRHYGFPPSRE
jgi:hypothetical protein